MRLPSVTVLAAATLVGSASAALAHHSFAMFDQENSIELDGIVQEFKYTNPHSYLLLEVRGDDGSAVVWNLEGQAPSILSRDGWSKESLRPGDHVLVTIDPLRSGAPGGAWSEKKTQFGSGAPIVTH